MVDPKIDSGIAYPVKFPKTAWNSPGYILTYRKKLSSIYSSNICPCAVLGDQPPCCISGHTFNLEATPLLVCLSKPEKESLHPVLFSWKVWFLDSLASSDFQRQDSCFQHRNTFSAARMRLLINWLKGVVSSLLEVVDSVNRILLIKNKISKIKKKAWRNSCGTLVIGFNRLWNQEVTFLTDLRKTN